ncbi:MAG: phosphoribosylformylglycinamidine cyclo-ligase [Candidatus Cloacimonadota bacterium]|nr:MAG: phosphoribosylformylglycinamidine cyclo-ligase [Candidatus Cloacimonadota bacterium]
MKYRDAGVNIKAAQESVKKIRRLARETFSSSVLTDIGSFGALFEIKKKYAEPVLVSSADGVGTKLEIATMTERYDTTGHDLVNHCVNDILTVGAEPLFFLDYIATPKLNEKIIEEIVMGLAKGCKENSCSLVGGEMAEMPDFYKEKHYDIAGFIVGIVEKKRIPDIDAVKPDDILIGLESNGLHTNGFSLVRKILFSKLKLTVEDYVPEIKNYVGEELLRVHRSYFPLLSPLRERGIIKGYAHITGGGFYDNIPRILPHNCSCIIDTSTWEKPPIFDFLKEQGDIPISEMYRTFNMGIGMVLIVDAENKEELENYLISKKEEFYEIGQVVAGERNVEIKF